MEKFAYVNKTYIKDINYSRDLYNTWVKFYKGDSKFYIICPTLDHPQFKNAFPEVEVIKEEEIVLKAGLNLEEFQAMKGWEQQQVIKLLAWKVLDVENYITPDSDSIFTKPFDDSIFFKNGFIKTVCYKGKFASGMNFDFNKVDEIYSKDAKIPEELTSKKMFFVINYQLWNASVLKDLEAYIKTTELKDFNKMINSFPFEAAWYGNFIYIFKRSLFFPQVPVFTNIAGTNVYSEREHRNYFFIYFQYLHKVKYKKSKIGVFVHYNSGQRAEKTLVEIIEEYEKYKPSQMIYHLIYFISAFVPIKTNRRKFREYLVKQYLAYLKKVRKV